MKHIADSYYGNSMNCNRDFVGILWGELTAKTGQCQ